MPICVWHRRFLVEAKVEKKARDYCSAQRTGEKITESETTKSQPANLFFHPQLFDMVGGEGMRYMRYKVAESNL